MGSTDIPSKKFWAVEHDPDLYDRHILNILDQAKRACVEPNDATHYLLRGLVAYDQAEDSKKSVLLTELTRNLRDLKGDYGAKGPEPVYDKLLHMLNGEITMQQRGQLINFGFDLVESESHSSSKNFLDKLYGYIKSRTGQIIVTDYHAFLNRLDKIMESGPEMATASYVSFCCFMFNLNPISEEKFGKKHVSYSYPQYVCDIETIYDLAHRNLETIVYQLTCGTDQAQLTQLFNDDNRKMLEAVKNGSTKGTKLMAEAILADLSSLQTTHTLNPSPYRQTSADDKMQPR